MKRFNVAKALKNDEKMYKPIEKVVAYVFYELIYKPIFEIVNISELQWSPIRSMPESEKVLIFEIDVGISSSLS